MKNSGLILAALALLLALGACGQLPNCSSYECRTFTCAICEGTP